MRTNSQIREPTWVFASPCVLHPLEMLISLWVFGHMIWASVHIRTTAQKEWGILKKASLQGQKNAVGRALESTPTLFPLFDGGKGLIPHAQSIVSLLCNCCFRKSKCANAKHVLSGMCSLASGTTLSKSAWTELIIFLNKSVFPSELNKLTSIWKDKWYAGSKIVQIPPYDNCLFWEVNVSESGDLNLKNPYMLNIVFVLLLGGM